MKEQEDRIRKEQEEKLLEEILSFHILRKNEVLAQKLLKALRIIAWYNYIAKSGVELHTIRLKPRGIAGKDTYRRWNHWKNGNGKLEEDDLSATEIKVPGSRKVFEEGPDGAPLWKALDNTNNAYYEASNYYDAFIMSPIKTDTASTKSQTNGLVKLRKIIFKENSYWHKLTRAVLLHRQHTNVEIIPFSEDDRLEIFTIKLSNRSKIDLVDMLANLKSESAKHDTPHEIIIEIINRLYLAPFEDYIHHTNPI